MRKALFIILFVITFVFALQGVRMASADLCEGLQDSGCMFELSEITHDQLPVDDFRAQGINFILTRVINILLAIAGGAAVFVITLGGFMMILSGGSEALSGKGKEYVQKALIGLLFVLLAYILVASVQFLIASIYAK